MPERDFHSSPSSGSSSSRSSIPPSSSRSSTIHLHPISRATSSSQSGSSWNMIRTPGGYVHLPGDRGALSGEHLIHRNCRRELNHIPPREYQEAMRNSRRQIVKIDKIQLKRS